jgi:uncharacterized protein DUF4434
VRTVPAQGKFERRRRRPKAGPGRAPRTGPRVRGAFLSALDEHDAAYWRAALRDMHRMGMDVAIIQTEAYLEPEGGGWTLDAVGQPLIEAVLDAASGEAMRVFVGLALPESANGDPQAARDEALMAAIIDQSKESAGRVSGRYGASPAFAGFYLPLETWTPGSPGELGHLPEYLAQVSHHCRRLVSSKEIAISPFVSDLATDPALTEATYTEILGASEIDIVMIQDGVGARGVAVADFGTRVTPYLVAMKAAADAAGRQIWVNAESFAGDAPAPRARFRAQLELARTVTRSIVTFEYASYCLCSGAR